MFDAENKKTTLFKNFVSNKCFLTRSSRENAPSPPPPQKAKLHLYEKNSNVRLSKPIQKRVTKMVLKLMLKQASYSFNFKNPKFDFRFS